MGVPVILAGSGIEKVIELTLTEDEQATLKRSVVSYGPVLASHKPEDRGATPIKRT